ncbi:S-adenosylmethionine decarboxylase [Canna indica]|uniref:S-adenosylmethionine decarboxylase n=1 Tax=Canna indica TaxID=4628 RepID=A0AAQ3JSJ9_9LILI|nr:S-adenosylmethionine decarboxylase [Canna indica]
MTAGITRGCFIKAYLYEETDDLRFLFSVLFKASIASSSSFTSSLGAASLGFSLLPSSSSSKSLLLQQGGLSSGFEIRGQGTDLRCCSRLFRTIERIVNELMESKAGKKSSNSSLQYEAPLGYSIEDVRPHGGIKKFQSAAYSNCVRKPS